MNNTITSIKTDEGRVLHFNNIAYKTSALIDYFHCLDSNNDIGVFRSNVSDAQKVRIEKLLYYRQRIISQIGEEEFNDLFSYWPKEILSWNGKLVLITPHIIDKYVFTDGKFIGKEKYGAYFTRAKIMNQFLDDNQKGSVETRLRMCLRLSTALDILHQFNLGVTSLDSRQILLDPITGSASILSNSIYIGDNYLDWCGVTGIQAPEIEESKNEPYYVDGKINLKKSVICPQSDNHSLAVIIYMILFNRHPLQGGRVCDLDPAKDEELSMGKLALFIEHPTDTSNRPNIQQMTTYDLPQGDIVHTPYSSYGLTMTKLFNRAFIDGLHNPFLRPTSKEWVNALKETMLI